MKVGDKVFVDESRYGKTILIPTVISRQTKTRWVISDGTQFHKKDLRAVGYSGEYNIPVLREVTDDTLQIYNNKKTYNKYMHVLRELGRVKDTNIQERVIDFYNKLLVEDNVGNFPD